MVSSRGKRQETRTERGCEAKGEVDALMTQRSQVCQHFDLGLPASRMVRSHYVLAKLLQPMSVPPQTFQYSRTQLEGHDIVVPFPKAREIPGPKRLVKALKDIKTTQRCWNVQGYRAGVWPLLKFTNSYCKASQTEW